MRAWLLFFTLLPIPGRLMAALAQEPPVTVECNVSQNQITVGDPVDLRISIRYAPGYRVGSLPELDFGKLEILDRQVLSPPPGDDGQQSTLFLIRFTAFEPGEFETPLLQLPYSQGDSPPEGEVSCAPIGVRVDAVLPENAADLQDIKLPRDLPQELWPQWLWLPLVLLLAGVGFWLWRRYRGRAGEASEKTVPRLPPYEEARRALEQLSKLQLPLQGETKRHYVELSEIIRRYIERRFGLMALEMTTGQILAQMRSDRGRSEYMAPLSRLLRESDLVKFARLDPPLGTNQELVEIAFAWLEATRPSPPPDSEAQQPESTS